MKKSLYFAKGVWVNRHLAQWVTTIVIMVHISLGIAVIAGGLARFTLPSYEPLIFYSGGHVWIWGVWIMVSAILISTPFRWPNILGLWIGLVWHIIWMTCFTIAAVRYETAAATPVPMYGGMAMISAALLAAKVIEKSEG